MEAAPTILQYVFAALTLVCACLVVLGKNPVISAMALMGTLFSTGILYFSLQSYFIGAVQILIYAGAISVLFIFIVMLLDLSPLRLKIPGRSFVHGLAALAGLLILGATLAAVLPALQQPGLMGFLEAVSESPQATGPLAISLRFLSKYMIPFQMTALLLLAAVMGVVVLGRPGRPKPAAGEPLAENQKGPIQ